MRRVPVLSEEEDWEGEASLKEVKKNPKNQAVEIKGLTETRESYNWKKYYLPWHQKIRTALCCTNRAPSWTKKPSK